MAISAAAKSHHDQLFGDRVSALAQSDPELIEYFGNFAFDEVHADAARLDETLDLHTRLMVQLAAILAAGGLAEFRVMAAAAVANGGVSPVELKEIVYQSVAYVGMARAFDYLHAVNDVLTEAGVEMPLPGQSASTPQVLTSAAPALLVDSVELALRADRAVDDHLVLASSSRSASAPREPFVHRALLTVHRS